MPVFMYTYMYMYMHIYMQLVTKNVTKQIAKVNYLCCVLDEGIVWFLELVKKCLMLDCACTVYRIAENV